jgi:hypothetical protein
MIKVFVAGPLEADTPGAQFGLMRQGMSFCAELQKLGYAVCNPWAILYLNFHTDTSIPKQEASLVEWLLVSDAVLVASQWTITPKIQRWIDIAHERKIPTFHSVGELENWRNTPEAQIEMGLIFRPDEVRLLKMMMPQLRKIYYGLGGDKTAYAEVVYAKTLLQAVQWAMDNKPRFSNGASSYKKPPHFGWLGRWDRTKTDEWTEICFLIPPLQDFMRKLNVLYRPCIAYWNKVGWTKNAKNGVSYILVSQQKLGSIAVLRSAMESANLMVQAFDGDMLEKEENESQEVREVPLQWIQGLSIPSRFDRQSRTRRDSDDSGDQGREDTPVEMQDSDEEVSD